MGGVPCGESRWRFVRGHDKLYIWEWRSPSAIDPFQVVYIYMFHRLRSPSCETSLTCTVCSCTIDFIRSPVPYYFVFLCDNSIGCIYSLSNIFKSIFVGTKCDDSGGDCYFS